MIDQNLTAIQTAKEAANKALLDLREKLGGLNFGDGSSLDIASTEVPKTFGTVGDILTRTGLSIGLAEGAAGLDRKKALALPKSLLTAIESNLNTVQAESVALVNELVTQDGIGNYGRIELPGMTLFNQTGSPYCQLGGRLRSIDQAADNLFAACHTVNSVCRPESFDAFTSVAEHLRDVSSQAGEIREELLSRARSARQSSNRIEEAEALSSRNAGRISDDMSAGIEWSKEILKIKEKAEGLVSEIKGAHETATATGNLVESAAGKIALFDKQLNQLQEDHRVGKEQIEALVNNNSVELGKLIKELTELQRSVADLEAEGRRMIGNATNAYLAKSFHDSGDRITGPMLGAQVNFYTSLVLMGLSIAIAFNAIPFLHEYIKIPELQPTGASPEIVLVYLVGNILTRFSVVLPSILLVGFAARRHRALFRLREHYLYKKAVATAVPGFKEQAGTYQDSVAASAFEQLLNNPMASVDASEVKRPGPIARWLSTVLAASLTKMKEAPGAKAEPTQPNQG